jgi:hypothetical protein
MVNCSERQQGLGVGRFAIIDFPSSTGGATDGTTPSTPWFEIAPSRSGYPPSLALMRLRQDARRHEVNRGDVKGE